MNHYRGSIPRLDSPIHGVEAKAFMAWHGPLRDCLSPGHWPRRTGGGGGGGGGGGVVGGGGGGGGGVWGVGGITLITLSDYTPFHLTKPIARPIPMHIASYFGLTIWSPLNIFPTLDLSEDIRPTV